MLQPVDYGAFLRSGQSLVPDLAAEAIRERLAGAQEQEAQTQALRAQAQLAEQQRETNDAQAFQQAVAEYQQRPTVEGLSALMVRFPQFSEGLKRAFDAQDESQQRSDFRSLGQIHSSLLSGRADLALGELDRRIAADRAAGREVDPIEQDMRDAIASGDPQRVATAQGMARRVVALIAGPERMASVFGVDNPQFRNVAPGEVVMDERTGTIAQSPVGQIVSGPGGVSEFSLIPGVPVLGGGVAPPAAETPQAGTTTASPGPAPSRPYPGGNQAQWRVISSPGAPRDGGRRTHAGYDIVPPNGDATWRPNQPFRIERPRGQGTRRQGLTADVVFQDGTRVQAMHLRDLPQATPDGTWLPAGSVAVVAGNTGNAGTTPTHIHAEAYRGRQRVDPRPFFGISGGRQTASQAGGPVRVRSRQQYERLARGAEYIDPNGVRRVKQ